MCFLSKMYQTYAQWNSSRRQGHDANPGTNRTVSSPLRPPSEIGSIRSTMSVSSLEARMNSIEVQLAVLANSSEQQASLLTRQSLLIESLLERLGSKSSTGQSSSK